MSDRITADLDELDAAGVYLNSWGVDGKGNVVRVEARAPDEQAARALLAERYGDAVAFTWNGAEESRIEPHPWGAWAVDASGREIIVHYAANSVGRPLAPIVEETPDEVRITARDLMPNGPVTLVGAVHEATATLAAPLGKRRVVDGATGRVA